VSRTKKGFKKKERKEQRNAAWLNDGGCGFREEDGCGNAVPLCQGSWSFLAAHEVPGRALAASRVDRMASHSPVLHPSG